MGAVGCRCRSALTWLLFVVCATLQTVSKEEETPLSSLASAKTVLSLSPGDFAAQQFRSLVHRRAAVELLPAVGDLLALLAAPPAEAWPGGDASAAASSAAAKKAGTSASSPAADKACGEAALEAACVLVSLLDAASSQHALAALAPVVKRCAHSDLRSTRSSIPCSFAVLLSAAWLAREARVSPVDFPSMRRYAQLTSILAEVTLPFSHPPWPLLPRRLTPALCLPRCASS